MQQRPYFSQTSDYREKREWKDFLYQVKLSLYSRFPECFNLNSRVTAEEETPVYRKVPPVLAKLRMRYVPVC
jgi:hypothetical protein